MVVVSVLLSLHSFFCLILCWRTDDPRGSPVRFYCCFTFVIAFTFAFVLAHWSPARVTLADVTSPVCGRYTCITDSDAEWVSSRCQNVFKKVSKTIKMEPKWYPKRAKELSKTPLQSKVEKVPIDAKPGAHF